MADAEKVAGESLEPGDKVVQNEKGEVVKADVAPIMYAAVPVDLANEILNYLADQPFRQVAHMIVPLQQVSTGTAIQEQTP